METSSHEGHEEYGLLVYEQTIDSLFPLHAGMRQYWRPWGRSSHILAERELYDASDA